VLTDDHAAWGHTASTGLGFSTGNVVDAHFAACAGAYRTALDLAGLHRGWHVLDAGCGSGTFLPLLAERVGPQGRLSAVDLAPENAALARRRARRELPGDGSAPPVDVRTGDVLDLPYPDGTFDAVWCANTVQYLDDGELPRALAEFRRVVRPGGVVAVKDLDAALLTLRPGDPFQLTDFFRHAARVPGYAHQLLRTRDLHLWLRRAGLTGVRQETLLIEHYAPLTPAAAHFYGLATASVARQALDSGLPERTWTPLLSPDHPAHPLRSADAYISEGNVVAVGTVPPGRP
jgi:ubiquinone/menaquinone biosynthesis C-methylase UbiE